MLPHHTAASITLHYKKGMTCHATYFKICYNAP